MLWMGSSALIQTPHAYRYSPLSLEAPFQHIAAILRVSSSEQLDLPSVHNLARSCLVAVFPSGPSPFDHPNHLEEALGLALRYNVTSVSPPPTCHLDLSTFALVTSLGPAIRIALDDLQIQKGLYYSLVTTTDFEPSSDATHDELPSKTIALTPTDVVRCRNLMNDIVEHFTPVLFEPVCPILSIASLFSRLAPLVGWCRRRLMWAVYLFQSPFAIQFSSVGLLIFFPSL